MPYAPLKVPARNYGSLPGFRSKQDRYYRKHVLPYLRQVYDISFLRFEPQWLDQLRDGTLNMNFISAGFQLGWDSDPSLYNRGYVKLEGMDILDAIARGDHPAGVEDITLRLMRKENKMWHELPRVDGRKLRSTFDQEIPWGVSSHVIDFGVRNAVHDAVNKSNSGDTVYTVLGGTDEGALGEPLAEADIATSAIDDIMYYRKDELEEVMSLLAFSINFYGYGALTATRTDTRGNVSTAGIMFYPNASRVLHKNEIPADQKAVRFAGELQDL